MCVSAAPTTVPATTTVEVAPATASGNLERRTSPGSVASPTPVAISPAKKAPMPESSPSAADDLIAGAGRWHNPASGGNSD